MTSLREQIAAIYEDHYYVGVGAPGQPGASEAAHLYERLERCACGTAFTNWNSHFGELFDTMLKAEIERVRTETRANTLQEAADHLRRRGGHGPARTFARHVQNLDAPPPENLQGPGYTVREMLERFEGEET